MGPVSDLVFHPATSFIHYGQAIFEGLKAFAQPDGGVAVFRPADHGDRMARSSTRLAMPQLPTALFVDSIRALVGADATWCHAVPVVHLSSPHHGRRGPVPWGPSVPNTPAAHRVSCGQLFL